MIRTPDRRVRVFVSSTLGELADERAAVRRAVEHLRLSPVMFEMGARPHPPRELYRAYLEQSDVFIGIYWERYGWVAPGEDVSGLEDEFRLADRMPQLLYIKEPAPRREERLSSMLRRVQDRDQASYRRFTGVAALEEMVASDLALLLSERFAGRDPAGSRQAVAVVPSPLTPTVGRAADVAAVGAALDGGARLVTVTGPGGVGKTRVAVEVARERAGHHPDEVGFVSLATISDPALVPTTIVDRLGAAGEEADPWDSLAAHVADRPALLVLDNLEQVASVAPDLARLLERTPRLQVLATSRHALRVVGEREVRIGPLEIPAAGAGAQDVARAAAVELLVDRARARGIPLQVTDANAAALAGLCERLAGLPLAIELAAPRLHLHAPEGLLRRLASTLDLTSGADDLPARQRTMRATLAWSLDLLAPGEKTVFGELSVFRGGVTLEAAEAVCSAEAGEVDEALAGLMDKSLLVADPAAAGGEPRFRMLEPVRELAAEELAARGTAAPTYGRHLQHVLALGARARPFVCGPHQQAWAARLDEERADIRTAVGTGMERRAYADVLRLVWDTLVYFYIRDAVVEPRAWLQQIVRDQDELGPVPRALLDVALVIVGRPPAADATNLLHRATNLFDRERLLLEAAVSRHYLGLQHWQRGRRRIAVAVLEEASRRYAALEHDWGVALVEMTLGAAHACQGRPAPAAAHFLESLVHSRRIENRPQIAQGLQGLAVVDALAGRSEAAAESVREAAGLVLEDRSVTAATYCLEAAGALRLAQGHPDEAVRLVAAARETRRYREIPEWTAAADAADPVLEIASRALPADSFDQLWRAGADRAGDVLDLLEHEVSQLAGAVAPAG